MTIAFGAAGTLAASSSATTIAPALPAFAVGNLFVGVAASKNNFTHSWPAGWTKVTQTNSGTLWTVSWAWRIARTGDAAPTVTIASTAVAATAQIWTYTGQDYSNPIGAVGTAAAGTTTPHTSTSITTTRANSLAIYIDACSINTALTAPSGYTQNVSNGSATSVTHDDAGSKSVAVAGSATGAISTTGGAAVWVQQQIEILSPNIGGYFSDHDIKPVNTGNTIAKRQMMQETAAWISPMSYCAFQYDFFAFQIVYGNPTYNAFQGCIAVPWTLTPSEYDAVHNYLSRLQRGSEDPAAAPFISAPAAPPTLPFSDLPLGQMLKPKPLDHIDAPAPAFGEFLRSFVSQWGYQWDIPHLKSRFDVGPDIWQPSFVRGEFLPDFVQWASQHDVPQLKKRFDVGPDIWQPSFVAGEFLQSYVSQWASMHDVPQLKKRFDVGPDIWGPTPVAGEFLPTLISQWASQHELPQLKKRFAVGEDIWQPTFVPSTLFVQWATGHDLPRLKSRFSVGEDIWQPSFVKAEFIPSYVTQWDIPHDLPRLKFRFSVGEDIWYPSFVPGEFPQASGIWSFTHHDPVQKTFNPIHPLDNIWHQTPAFGEFLQSYISQWASTHELAPVRSRTGINGEIVYEPQFVPAVTTLITAWPWTHHDIIAVRSRTAPNGEVDYAPQAIITPTLITAWPWTHHDPTAKTFNPIRPLDNIWHQTPAPGEFLASLVSQWASQHELPQLKKRFDVGADIWQPVFVPSTLFVQWATGHDLPRLKSRFSVGEDIWQPSFVKAEFIPSFVTQWEIPHDLPRLKSRFSVGEDIWLPTPVAGEFLPSFISQWASEHPIVGVRVRTGPSGEIVYEPQFIAPIVSTPVSWWMEYAQYQLPLPRMMIALGTQDVWWSPVAPPPPVVGGVLIVHSSSFSWPNYADGRVPQ